MVDLVVVGGGPGGYPAAIRGAQMGLESVIVEPGYLGGECTNYGCIPTKALLHEAFSLWSLKRRYESLDDVSANVLGPVRQAVLKVREGLESLIESYGIDVVERKVIGIRDSKTLLLDDGSLLSAERGIVIATGSVPVYPPGLEPDNIVVFDNRGFLARDTLPGSVLIVGAGYVGVEYAFSLAALGVKVYLVELLDRPLPGLDRDLGMFARRILRSMGVNAWFNTKVVGVARYRDRAIVKLEGKRAPGSLEVEAVLVATGRRPNVSIKGLERVGVKFGGRGEILVDCGMRAAEGIYAVGDVTGEPMLAHKAFEQARVAAENIAGFEACVDLSVVPMVVYTEPELVQVVRAGCTGSSDLRSVKIRVEAMPRSVIEGLGGFAKVLFEEGTGRIRGFVLAFRGAGEVAGEAAMIVKNGLTLREVAEVIHPHPSWSEALWEAVEAALGRPRHLK